MLRRHRPNKVGVEAIEIVEQTPEPHIVGGGGLDAAELHEQRLLRGFGQKIQKSHVVVAGERDHPFVAAAGGDQEVENAARLRAAIDIVAEMDDAPVGRTVAFDLAGDALMHLFQ